MFSLENLCGPSTAAGKRLPGITYADLMTGPDGIGVPLLLRLPFLPLPFSSSFLPSLWAYHELRVLADCNHWNGILLYSEEQSIGKQEW